jgi:PKD repeat protein
MLYQNSVKMKIKTTLFLTLVLLFSGLNAQDYVSTEPQNKNVVLEEFTGVRCGYCPQGHVIAASIVANNPGRAFVVAYHPSNSSLTVPYSGDPDFRRTYPNAFYNSSYCGTSPFMPGAFVNRRLSGGERLLSRSVWASRSNQILAESSPANMGISTSYDFFSKMLYITVEIYYTQTVLTDNSIYILLSENDLIARQNGGSNSYVHKHVFREAFVGQWGDPITEPTTQGSLITLQYEWDATGTEYLMGNCEVLAFLQDQTSEEVITGVGVDVGEQTYIQPTAGFSVEDNTVGVGYQAIFTDESDHTPTAWDWTFEGGDPASSTLQSPPPIMYDTPGQYSVTLIVTNPAGSDTMTMENLMDINYAPEAAFEASQTMIMAGEGVTFTDMSSYDPTSWYWEFEGGDPATSTAQNPPEIIYDTPGTYTVTFAAINEYGEDTLVEENYIQVGGVGVAEEGLQKAFSIYPNPTGGTLHIKPQGMESIRRVYLRNAGGQLVYTHETSSTMIQTLQLDELETGLYFLEIQTDRERYLEKVVLK